MKIENFVAHIGPPHVLLWREMNDNAAPSHGNARIGGVPRLKKQNGFTLIEIIISLVIVSILAAMIVTYFGSSMTQSGMPIARMGKALKLQTVMENISADYKRLYNGSTHDIATLKTSIDTNSGNYGGTGPSAIPYTAVTTYITYDIISCVNNCPEQPDSSGNPQLLKVRINDTTIGTGESLTVLFAK